MVDPWRWSIYFGYLILSLRNTYVSCEPLAQIAPVLLLNNEVNKEYLNIKAEAQTKPVVIPNEAYQNLPRVRDLQSTTVQNGLNQQQALTYSNCVTSPQGAVTPSGFPIMAILNQNLILPSANVPQTLVPAAKVMPSPPTEVIAPTIPQGLPPIFQPPRNTMIPKGFGIVRPVHHKTKNHLDLPPKTLGKDLNTVSSCPEQPANDISHIGSYRIQGENPRPRQQGLTQQASTNGRSQESYAFPRYAVPSNSDISSLVTKQKQPINEIRGASLDSLSTESDINEGKRVSANFIVNASPTVQSARNHITASDRSPTGSYEIVAENPNRSKQCLTQQASTNGRSQESCAFERYAVSSNSDIGSLITKQKQPKNQICGVNLFTESNINEANRFSANSIVNASPTAESLIDGQSFVNNLNMISKNCMSQTLAAPNQFEKTSVYPLKSVDSVIKNSNMLVNSLPMDTYNIEGNIASVNPIVINQLIPSQQQALFNNEPPKFCVSQKNKASVNPNIDSQLAPPKQRVNQIDFKTNEILTNSAIYPSMLNQLNNEQSLLNSCQYCSDTLDRIPKSLISQASALSQSQINQVAPTSSLVPVNELSMKPGTLSRFLPTELTPVFPSLPANSFATEFRAQPNHLTIESCKIERNPVFVNSPLLQQQQIVTQKVTPQRNAIPSNTGCPSLQQKPSIATLQSSNGLFTEPKTNEIHIATTNSINSLPNLQPQPLSINNLVPRVPILNMMSPNLSPLVTPQRSVNQLRSVYPSAPVTPTELTLPNVQHLFRQQQSVNQIPSVNPFMCCINPASLDDTNRNSIFTNDLISSIPQSDLTNLPQNKSPRMPFVLRQPEFVNNIPIPQPVNTVKNKREQLINTMPNKMHTLDILPNNGLVQAQEIAAEVQETKKDTVTTILKECESSLNSDIKIPVAAASPKSMESISINEIQQIPITPEVDQFPISLYINIPPINLPAPKVTIVDVPINQASLKAPTVPSFAGYPPVQPILLEGSRSKKRSWLPIILALLLNENDGGCCCKSCNSCNSNISVPYPIPVPVYKSIPSSIKANKCKMYCEE